MNDGDDVEDKGPARLPFAVFLQDMYGGDVHAELTSALADLVETCRALDKPGELQLRIKITPEGGKQALVTGEVVVKAPTAKPPTAIYFVDPASNLVRDDPYQLQFGALREVPRPDLAVPKEIQQ